MPSFFTADQKQVIKGDYLKFNDGSSKLLSGHKFQDKYVILRAEKLLLYRDIKVSTLLSSSTSLLSTLATLGFRQHTESGKQDHNEYEKVVELFKKAKM